MQITTPRLILRPLTDADTEALARMVFSDKVVMSTMQQDTRTQDAARKWAQLWIAQGGQSAGHVWGDNGIGVFAISPRLAPEVVIGSAGFIMKRGQDGLWKGQFVFALGSAFHDRGVMREAAEYIAPYLHTLNDLSIIYGVYWEGIAPMAQRILRAMRFSSGPRRPVLTEYTADACLAMFRYDLWNLSNAREKDVPLLAVRAASRAGTFAAEGILGKKPALTLLVQRAPKVSPDLLLRVMNTSFDAPGLGYMDFRGPGAKEVPANPLRTPNFSDGKPPQKAA
jgi:RimJ/RimL family protein N-acetyltransferase